MNESSWLLQNEMRGIFNTQPYDYVQIINLIKRTPEAIGIIRAMITDILSDGVVWRGSTKNKIAKAKDWAKKKQIWTKKLPAGLVDWFIFGNNLIWPGIKIDQVKELAIEQANIELIEIKETKQNEILNKIIGEVAENSLDYRNVPWSTVTIDSNGVDVTGFSQHMGVSVSPTGVTTPGVSGEQRSWDANEVIHATLMELDGKAYGYSPMIASLSVISTLALIKDYNGFKFENGGEPDLIFSFPQEIADNPNVKALVRHLTEKRKARNKGGHFVMTGEVNITHVSDHNKDMEYRHLAIYYTGILAFAFNMPIGRIQSILGSEVKMGSQDLSDTGYWRSISNMQRYWEDLLNTNIFEPQFGVTFKFKRSYKQVEVREAQSKMLNIQWMRNLMASMKLKPSKNYVKEVLAVDEEDFDWKFFEKLDPNDLGPVKGDGNPMSDNEVDGNDGKLAADKKKKDAMAEKVNVP